MFGGSIKSSSKAVIKVFFSKPIKALCPKCCKEVSKTKIKTGFDVKV